MPSNLFNYCLTTNYPIGPSPCAQGLMCINSDGSYKCDCSDGFLKEAAAGASDPHCVDIDECANGSSKCSDLSSCLNTVGSYKCSCNTGYSGDGISCQVFGSEKKDLGVMSSTTYTSLYVLSFNIEVPHIRPYMRRASTYKYHTYVLICT